MLPWVITRAEPDAGRVCEELRRAGLEAFALPCIERVPCEVPAWRPDGHRVVLLTSVPTVEIVGPRLWLSAPDELAVLAPASSAALSALGYRATIEASGGVLELVARIEGRLRQRAIGDPVFWWPTSDAGLSTDEQRVAVARLEALGPVTRTAVYETRRPERLDHRLAQLARPFGVVFASPSAVENFFATNAPEPEAVVCWGHSTFTAARRFFERAIEHDRSHPLAVTLTQEPLHG